MYATVVATSGKRLRLWRPRGRLMGDWRESALSEHLLALIPSEGAAKALIEWLRGVPEMEREARIRALPELEARVAKHREQHRAQVSRWRANREKR